MGSVAPPIDHEPVLVGHRAVVGQPVDLVAGGVVADLGDDELDLIRFLAAWEKIGPEGLRVGVGEAPRPVTSTRS